jgi:hypothetical protein
VKRTFVSLFSDASSLRHWAWRSPRAALKEIGTLAKLILDEPDLPRRHGRFVTDDDVYLSHPLALVDRRLPACSRTRRRCFAKGRRNAVIAYHSRRKRGRSHAARVIFPGFRGCVALDTRHGYLIAAAMVFSFMAPGDSTDGAGYLTCHANIAPERSCL